MILSRRSILSFSREISSCRLCLCRSPGAATGRGGFLVPLAFVEAGVLLGPARRLLFVS